MYLYYCTVWGHCIASFRAAGSLLTQTHVSSTKLQKNIPLTNARITNAVSGPDHTGRKEERRKIKDRRKDERSGVNHDEGTSLACWT